ncbi:hypothetical protein DFS33DRAFT_1379381 [Desarmillaria ectypa]|nr:hypothetical protein DFS33DRAFT_1379381 [Desarmillaria ectypa]
MKEAEHRGITLDALKLYLVTRLNLAAPAYYHLEDANFKVYIAFFTAFAIYFDDTYPDDPDALVGSLLLPRRITWLCRSRSGEIYIDFHAGETREAVRQANNWMRIWAHELEGV